MPVAPVLVAWRLRAVQGARACDARAEHLGSDGFSEVLKRAALESGNGRVEHRVAVLRNHRHVEIVVAARL